MGKYNKEIRLKNKKAIVWALFLSVVVLLPNIFLACYGNDIAEASFFKQITFLIISVFLFLMPSLFLKMRTFFLFYGIFVLLAPFEIVHIYLNRMPITTVFLLSIFDTSWSESTELLAAIKVPILFLIIIWFIYFYITLKKIDNVFLIRSLKVRMYFLGVFLIFLFLGYSFHFSSEYYTKADKKEVFNSTNEYLLTKSNLIYPYNFIINTYKVYTVKTKIKKGWDKIRSFSFSTYKKEPIDDREVYVFVIGETGRYNSFIRRISKDTDEEFFMPIDFEADNNYDEKLWEYLSEILKREEQKVLIVLHTSGSHFRYNFRYPPAYEIFKPSLKGSFDYNMISVENKEMFINTYDNSIVYTDFFLTTTIRKLDSLKTVSALVYVADHGENLFDKVFEQ